MHYMTTAEIREAYLHYFEEKGCKRMPSSSLIPDDPSLLLTSAGMVQFKPYFLQQKHLEAPYIGTTTVQKCVRTNDIDIIGTDGRHLSFFEMLGNFSFGEYFKSEMCAWALDFSVNVLGLPMEKLYFTVFENDDETIEIWKDLGVEESHITKLGEDDNFWRAGPTGPCGPCSEIYFDQGPEVGCGSPDCAPGCDCDRFLEYWNCVFTQYDGQEDGTLAPLPKKNIDTGMGLERIAAIMQGVQSNFDTDVLHGLIQVGERLSGKTYGEDEAVDMALRVMADHARSVTFMIADGILPSNEGRGYVLRRLLRRAVMKGHLLNVEGAFLGSFVDNIIEVMGPVYPEIVENRELIHRVVLSEEERFGATLRQGRTFLAEELDALSGNMLSGQAAFTLHDTYGFPLEVTQEMCAERGIEVDTKEFEECMQAQRERARAATQGDAEAAWSTYDGSMNAILEEVGATEFCGYAQNEAQATVKALVRDGQRVTELHAGEEGGIVLDVTPFYAEMGGQVGDTGAIFCASGRAAVSDTKQPEKGLYMHYVRVEEGTLSQGDAVTASIDVLRRERIRRNHTATHILHRALREVLGDHVKQAGSLVAPDRLRFDFTHFEGVSREQLDQVEEIANRIIMENHAVNTYETSLSEARESGVTALFGEKYGEVVRVVDVDGFSKELCGGTHVSNTSEIGFVKITVEQSVGANLRRIEAVSSFDALAYMHRMEAELRATAAELNVPLFDVNERTASTLATLKDLQFKNKRARQAAAAGSLKQIVDENLKRAKAGYQLLAVRIDNMDAGALRNSWDIFRSHAEPACACVFVSLNGETPLIMAAGTDEAVEAGFNAGALIKKIAPAIKGGGGGKPTMAQAGGKDASGLDEALSLALQELM
ncbi:alanine--tRNA ligase [Denitrobacterium detoxificans]|jgi:alanyl-tRNA synthetase|uniref:alanine--tRNA ligase n=1 Tax=Denitrobacterium detoxificans TaxID=79604 RepID=UPI0026F07592|nr:alanine--tRNA ligase [Denitrobacterium detoxificans]MBE6465448.1 alanine--tRNA ligase [Denitrobacterium detoxificans]